MIRMSNQVQKIARAKAAGLGGPKSTDSRMKKASFPGNFRWSVSASGQFRPVVSFGGCRLQSGDATEGIFLCREGPFVNFAFFSIPVDIPFDCLIP